MKHLLTITVLLFSWGCGDATDPPGPDADMLADAMQIDASLSDDAAEAECSVLDQDCDTPLSCLWTGDNDDGRCLSTGGISGRGTREEGESCTAHALCQPGLGCFTADTSRDADIAVGACRVLCDLDDSTQCASGQTCTPYSGNTVVGRCL
jgi:hypothetical protein